MISPASTCSNEENIVATSSRPNKPVIGVLRPGGVFVVHTPVLEQRRYFNAAVDASPSGGRRFGHVRDGYNPDELVFRVEDAGFIVEDKRYTFGVFTAWLSDLDFELSRRKIRPLRLFTFLLAKSAGKWESLRPPKKGRGILVVAKKAG